jgi:hypothetical protein
VRRSMRRRRNADASGVMAPFRAASLVLVGSAAAGVALAQQPDGATAPKPQRPAASVSGAPTPPPAAPRTSVQFDPETGWPIVADTGAAGASPADRERSRAAGSDRARPAGSAAVPGTAKPAEPKPPLVSGTQLGSPLLDVFQATGSAGAWKQLGGVTVAWRLVTHGPQGEVLGTRDVVHTADTAFGERDRLEHTDGRVVGRVGAQAFAERAGLPLPAASDPGGADDAVAHELMLFGLQLRLPWGFADANTFAVVAREVETRGGERLRKIVLERRPAQALDVLGPEAEPRPRDRFELLYEPSSGRPKELVHRFACSRETRRVLLEDWREVGGVQLPFRRVYVDDALRPTTVLQIERITPQQVDERTFRGH